MPTLNDAAWLAYSTNSGTTGSLNNVELAYLSQVSGITSDDTEDHWKQVMVDLGYMDPLAPKSVIPNAQFNYWGDLGYTGSWNDRYFGWLTLGSGAFGPAVQIVPQGTVPTVGYCEWIGSGDCTATRDYTANDSGFTNPANSWAWTLEPPVAGVTITNGTTKTCTVTSANLDVDVSFNLKVVATDTVSTDSAERTSAESQYHRENLAVAIGEVTNDGCTWPEGDPPGCTAFATYKATATGTPTSIQWGISDITGGSASITAGQGTTDITVTTNGTGTVQYKLTVQVDSQFQTAQDSQTFSQSHAEETSGPAFLALSYDPADIATIGAAYLMKGVVTGVGDLTTTHTADLYAADNEGVYRQFGANEPVWSGGRVVRNHKTNSEDLTKNIAFQANVTPAPQSAVFTDGAGYLQLNTSNSNKPIKCRITAKLSSPDGKAKIGLFIASTLTSISVDLTTTPTVWTSPVYEWGGANTVCGLDNRTAYGGDELGGTVDCEWMMIEPFDDADSAAIPSEYVPNTLISVVSGSTTKTFASTNGNTVLNNVVTEAVGTPLPEVPYLQYYPAAQNDCLYSRDLTNAAWLTFGTISTALDEVGITGEPNTATTVTDTGSTVDSVVYQESNGLANRTMTTVAWVKKSTTDVPRAFVQSRAGGNAGTGVGVNLQTGYVWAVGSGVDAVEAIDDGDWWKILLQVTHVSQNNYRQAFNPSWFANDDDTVQDATLTGSAIIGNWECHLATIAGTRGLGPIFTEASAVLTDKTLYSFDIANHNLTEGAWYVEARNDPETFVGSVPMINTNNLGTSGNVFIERTATFFSSWANANVNLGSVNWNALNYKFGTSYYAGTSEHGLKRNDKAWVDTSAFSAWPSTIGQINLLYTLTTYGNVTFSFRNLQRQDISSYQEGKDWVDGLMP